jgi:cellulose synthase/poly-beta-1,6-N-acetylglucosamine synthase-like glycosyltransferase
MITAVFWLCVFLIFYHHVAYPVLLRVLARIRHHYEKGVHTQTLPPAQMPSITVIVPAYNESAVIGAKIANLAALAYPSDKLSVVLALDGCTDDTKAIVDAMLPRLNVAPTWQIVEYASNIGKIAVLNQQIGGVTSEMVALSDASALIETDSLIRAARHFADPKVGVVCATYRLAQAGSMGEQAYWNYQTRVKADEAALAAPMGAHGAFYLFRRGLWSPLPDDTINDDFMLPMRIVLQGYRSIYDEQIVTVELQPSQAKDDFFRRVRIGAGNLQQVLRLPGLGNPRRGCLAFVFLSGKALRAVMPFVILSALVVSTLLAAGGRTGFGLLLTGEIVLLCVSLAPIFFSEAALPKPVAWLSYLLIGYTANALGSLALLAGRSGRRWRPSTPKSSRH